MQNILYIHGFNSSPLSMKAELTKQYVDKYQLEVNWTCPQLATSPRAAITQLESIVNNNPSENWAFIGSSLGGYFASYLAEKYDGKAVLVNPAVRPFELLMDYLGQQENPYTGEVYQVTEQHMHELQALYQEKISTQNYMVMVQTGDEVLDYRQAVEKYQHSRLIVQDGGDHSFINFEAMLPSIMSFIELQ